MQRTRTGCHSVTPKALTCKDLD
ncbi:rCG61242 [Rattus norvegicus]|uniref:RCG61242 n=1 Tax=Rattus norvegicus TaxID=10116 RepID=A6KE66_RAT|nr:rCG61242 [Rattus norvegicus]